MERSMASLLERPEMAAEFMAHPLPGQTLEEPSRIITLFPDTLIATRYSTLVIERQMPISAGQDDIRDPARLPRRATRPSSRSYASTIGRSTGRKTPETCRRTGRPGWRSSAACRASACDIACWRAASRQNDGLRGDDNRIRSFWKEWRGYMGMVANAPPH